MSFWGFLVGKLMRQFMVGCCLFCSLSVLAQEDRWDDLMERATSAWRVADFASARKLVAEAVYQGRYDNADRHVSSLVLQARIEQDAGDLIKAEEALRKAIETIDRIPGPLQEDKAVLHNNLGVLLDLASDLAGAEQHYRAALALHKALPALRIEDRFSLRVNFAGLLERRGDIRNARALYAEAETLLPHLPPSAATTLNNNLAALLQRQGDSAAALARLTQALADLPSATSAPLIRASVLHNLGTSELETGALVLAHAHLREAELIRRTRLGDQHPDTARTLASLALLLERQHRYDAGLAVAREASHSIMATLAGNAGTRAAAAPVQERREWRDSFSTHLRLLSRAEPDASRQAGEALSLMQSIKHGELARVFASASIGSEGEIGQRTRAIRQQMGRFQAKDQELTQTLQSEPADNGREKRLRQELATEREALANLQQELSRLFPRYHELVAGSVTPLVAVQASLAADEAVLVYLVSSNDTFFVALTRSTARFFKSALGQADLGKLVMRIRQTVDPEKADATGAFAFDEAHRIYRELIAPATASLADKAVWFVIPDGPLESLPFSLLLESSVTPEARKDYAKAPWVLRTHALVTLPSLGALTLARSATAPAPAPDLLI
ncbi:MAG: tetratricopeptide repeat protein, partial [Pseudomonadota bacterium]